MFKDVNQFEHPRYCVRIIFSVMPLILWKAKENKKQEIAVRRQKQRTRICHKRQIFDLGDRQMCCGAFQVVPYQSPYNSQVGLTFDRRKQVVVYLWTKEKN